MAKNSILSKLKRAVNIVLPSKYKFECPFCGYKANDLSPIGFDIPVLRDNNVIGAGLRKSGCYNCGSFDRDRLVYIYLKHILNIFENKGLNILHLAPEKNLSKIFIRAGFENYICGDLFTKGYKYPEYVQNINVLNIPYKDQFFDLIICNHLLEHVPKDTEAMKEIFRVLKPKGRAILQVPISKKLDKTFEDFSVTNPKQREIVFGQFDHVRIYGQDYVTRLSSVGFKVDRINISNKFKKYGLNIDEDIFVGIK